ncbi:MAG: zinc metalloprotease HtpX [Hyphomicrobiales bacterium]
MRRPALDPELHRGHSVRNVVHSWALVGGSALLMAVIAWAVYGSRGLIWAALLGGFGLWSMSRMSPRIVLGLYKAQPLSLDELPEIQRLVRELARRADLPTVPRLYHVPSRMLNAFAVGGRDDSAVAVTDGLLRSMTPRQIAGILAHEISHIRAGDLKVMALADVLNRLTSVLLIVGIIGIPAFIAAGMNVPWFGLLLLVFAPTSGGLLQLGLARTREFDADLEGAALTGDPEGLASALQTLERRQGGAWEELLPRRFPDPSLLRTHPRTADRIRRLMILKPSGVPPILPSGERRRPRPSIVPAVRGPRVHWPRMGL